MTDWESVGAALFISGLIGAFGYGITVNVAPGMVAPFSAFYALGTLGLCLIAAGDSK